MGGLQERVNLAIESGDVTEAARLMGSEWCSSWTTQRARQLVREIKKGRRELSPSAALFHMVLMLLEVANQQNVARAENNALRKRVFELEERVDSVTVNAMSYRGVFRDEHAPYRVGELVTHKGGLWHCWKATRDRPGTSDDWQLMSKNSRQEW